MSVQANRMGSSTARALVKQISKQHGYLGEEVLSRMDPDVRREVEEALLKKDAMIGSSVITYDRFLINSSCFLTGLSTSQSCEELIQQHRSLRLRTSSER
jgi:hypothetical protein